MRRQIEKMLAVSKDPRRQVREDATNFPWILPVFAVAFAIGKLSRVLDLRDGMIRLTDIPAIDMAEELREAAHYLLRAADLLESEEGKEAGHAE